MFYSSVEWNLKQNFNYKIKLFVNLNVIKLRENTKKKIMK